MLVRVENTIKKGVGVMRKNHQIGLLAAGLITLFAAIAWLKAWMLERKFRPNWPREQVPEMKGDTSKPADFDTRRCRVVKGLRQDRVFQALLEIGQTDIEGTPNVLWPPGTRVVPNPEIHNPAIFAEGGEGQ